MRLPSYKRMVQHEYERKSNDLYMSDVYDSPSWKQFMGKVESPNNRMGKCDMCHMSVCVVIGEIMF